MLYILENILKKVIEIEIEVKDKKEFNGEFNIKLINQ